MTRMPPGARLCPLHSTSAPNLNPGSKLSRPLWCWWRICKIIFTTRPCRVPASTCQWTAPESGRWGWEKREDRTRRVREGIQSILQPLFVFLIFSLSPESRSKLFHSIPLELLNSWHQEVPENLMEIPGTVELRLENQNDLNIYSCLLINSFK